MTENKNTNTTNAVTKKEEKERKKTKLDLFNEILLIVKEPEHIDFIKREIELLETRAANKKMTKTQEANESIKQQILDVLRASDEPLNIDKIQEGDPDLLQYKGQKISALLRQLKESGLVDRTEKKGRAFFSAV